MSVIVWWRERLVARFPLSPALAVEGYNYKMREGSGLDPWPMRVARQALYDDYRSWVDGANALAWPGVEEGDKRLSKPVPDYVFFTSISQMLYVHEKGKMVKNYWVKRSVPFEGGFQTVKVRRYFVRLGTWEEHAAAFAKVVGSPLPVEAKAALDRRETLC